MNTQILKFINQITEKITIYVYYNKSINFQYLDQIKNNTPKRLNIIEFKMIMINTSINCEKLINSDEFFKLPRYLFNNYIPEYFELNIVEIMNSKNSKLEDNVFLFRHNKILYSKKFFCILNSLKFSFNSFRLNNKILDNIIKYANISNDLFDIKTQHLQIALPSILKIEKFIFNLYNDYESILIRKIKYEDIFKFITTRPNDSNFKINEIKLKNYDLNTFSKILSRIEDNNIIFCNNKTFSIGGKFKILYNKIEYLVTLNTLIEINSDYSIIKIINFSENYLLPHFSAAATIFDNKIILLGGMSMAELLPNFNLTPLFIINLNNYIIERVISKNSKNAPGVIFNHKIKLESNKLKIYDGFCITGYSGGLSFKIEQETPTVIKNDKIFYYDLKENEWIV